MIFFSLTFSYRKESLFSRNFNFISKVLSFHFWETWLFKAFLIARLNGKNLSGEHYYDNTVSKNHHNFTKVVIDMCNDQMDRDVFEGKFFLKYLKKWAVILKWNICYTSNSLVGILSEDLFKNYWIVFKIQCIWFLRSKFLEQTASANKTDLISINVYGFNC